MALVLDRGRPRARSYHLLETLTAWVAKMRAQRAQREALAYLLELDAYRLTDSHCRQPPGMALPPILEFRTVPLWPVRKDP